MANMSQHHTLPVIHSKNMTLEPYHTFYQKNYDTRTISYFFTKKITTLGDIHIITTLYLMVVTCGNGNFKLPHSNFCKISFFFFLARTSLFRQKFLRKLSREDFHFFFAKIFARRFSFFFLCENFLFCFCHLSCIYSLY